MRPCARYVRPPEFGGPADRRQRRGHPPLIKRQIVYVFRAPFGILATAALFHQGYDNVRAPTLAGLVGLVVLPGINGIPTQELLRQLVKMFGTDFWKLQADRQVKVTVPYVKSSAFNEGMTAILPHVTPIFASTHVPKCTRQRAPATYCVKGQWHCAMSLH
jgi:hypothetical protein